MTGVGGKETGGTCPAVRTGAATGLGVSGAGCRCATAVAKAACMIISASSAWFLSSPLCAMAANAPAISFDKPGCLDTASVSGDGSADWCGSAATRDCATGGVCNSGPASTGGAGGCSGWPCIGCIALASACCWSGAACCSSFVGSDVKLSLIAFARFNVSCTLLDGVDRGGTDSSTAVGIGVVVAGGCACMACNTSDGGAAVAPGCGYVLGCCACCRTGAGSIVGMGAGAVACGGGGTIACGA